MTQIPLSTPAAKPAQGKDWRAIRERADGVTLGIEMAASVGLGYYVGNLVDGHFETAPWGTAFFLLAGAGSALKAVMRFYRQAKKVMARKEPGEAVAAVMDRVADDREGRR
jgi:F0F1-type ATP synthase assembly protein I